MLLIDIVESGEGQEELFHLLSGRLESDVKAMVALLSDGLVHVAFKDERFISDGVEASRGWDLAFVLQQDRENAVSSDSCLAEPQDWGAIGVELVRLLDLQRGQGAFASEFEDELAGLGFGVSRVHDCLEDASILHHCGWVEADTHILMLVRVNSKAIWLHIEGEAFTLALRTRLDRELDGARNLVWIDDLESLASAIWVL